MPLDSGGTVSSLWVLFPVTEPFQGFGLYTLDERCRLVLPRGLESFVTWFDESEPRDCLAVPGRRGLVLFPPTALAEHRELVARLPTSDSRPDDLGSSAFELARTATITWTVTIGKDRRFQLPLGARELGIVPAVANARVGLVAFRGVIEIWHPSELREQIQEAAGRWADLKAHGLPTPRDLGS